MLAAPKLGRGSAYQAGSAAYDWFLFDSEGDRIVLIWDDPSLQGVDYGNPSDDYMGTELDTEEVQRLWQEAREYTDVTETVRQRLIDAEQLATEDDFKGTVYDMGVPLGYIRKLYEIWRTHS